jgi:hypothetical protein
MLMFNNIKYFKNFKKHRNLVFLSNKIFFNKNYTKNNSSRFLDNFENFVDNNKNFRKKKIFPISSFYVNLFLNVSVLNNKFFDFLKIKKITNINYNFFVNFLSNLFKYSYFCKFLLEFIIFLSFIIYSFKLGTFY